MQESIRLRPVLPVIFRRAMRDVQIGPYLLPEGTILELHTLAMNTHPHYWERPDDFVPVRHLHLEKFKRRESLEGQFRTVMMPYDRAADVPGAIQIAEHPEKKAHLKSAC
jgi:hypothetical protein